MAFCHFPREPLRGKKEQGGQKIAAWAGLNYRNRRRRRRARPFSTMRRCRPTISVYAALNVRQARSAPFPPCPLFSPLGLRTWKSWLPASSSGIVIAMLRFRPMKPQKCPVSVSRCFVAKTSRPALLTQKNADPPDPLYFCSLKSPLHRAPQIQKMLPTVLPPIPPFP